MRKIFRTDLLFTATGPDPIDGFVAVEGSRIVKVGKADEFENYVSPDDEVYDLSGKVLTPGFVDNHVFFTGYIWQRIGFDASSVTSEEELLSLIKKEAGQKTDGPVLGHGLPDELTFDTDSLNQQFPDRPVMVFNEAREYCFMNKTAEERYGFTGDECYAEACWQLFSEWFKDLDFAEEEYLEFQDMLSARGITSIKEIGFDDYYGFMPVLKKMEQDGKLKHRVNLVSQPVSRDADFSYGQACRNLFTGDQVQFMGYNLMVDGDIEAGDGDLIDEYRNHPGTHCGMEIDYQKLEDTVLEADRQGFRCALHAEGDAAVRKSIDIYEKCEKINGKRDARHAIVDMELIDPVDRKRLHDLDITAMLYIQIMNCYDSRDRYWDREILSDERARTIWAYHSLLQDGVRVCFGTDLPLDVPDIPRSIRYGTYRLFPDGTPEGGYHKEEALSPAEILTCWSKNGQAANFAEDRLGTIEEGKLADFAVLDTNVFDCGVEELDQASVCMTVYNGEIVYTK